MKSYGIALLVGGVADLEGLGGVVPDADRLVLAAGHHQLLPDAHVQPRHHRLVEAADHIVKHTLIVGAVQRDAHFEELVGARLEVEGLFLLEHHRSHRVVLLDRRLVVVQLDLDHLPLDVVDLLVLHLLIHYDFSGLSADDEALLVGEDALDFEVLEGTLLDVGNVLATVLQEHDLTHLRAHNDPPSVQHPRVAAVGSRQLTVLIVHLSVVRHELFLLQLIVFVGVGASDDNGDVGVVVRVEGALEGVGGLRPIQTNADLGHYLQLVPPPEDQLPVRLSRQSNQVRLLISRVETA
mmetsp:Transcript_20483/g.19449  ORF Transcript_20483/g.19449 Transcript_20483/m.19449 type:complete len:295 (-) Transcript_20483:396-1280(-)